MSEPERQEPDWKGFCRILALADLRLLGRIPVPPELEEAVENMRKEILRKDKVG